MRSRRGWNSSSTSCRHSSPFWPRPPQCSLNSTWVSRCGNTSSRSTGISWTPQNGGAGIGTSVRAAERTDSSSVGPSSGSGPFSRSLRASSRNFATSSVRRLGLDQLVHHGQAREGVLAVEDAGVVDLVGVLALRVEDPAAEVAVDRGAADQHRVLEAALVQLLHGQRHLLGGRDEQRGEADRGRVVLLRGVEDRPDRDLLAEVDDRVAVVGEDRVDERLADVVHVAEHGREHDGALRVALELVEVLLELRDGLLHHLGALEHERQDQLAGAELVADLLHGRQQHVVERRDGADLLDARRRSGPPRRPSCGAGCASAAPPRAPCRRSGRRPRRPPRTCPRSGAMKRSSASSRRLKTRSSASSRSSSGISAYGVMWFGLTIARSSPASTQWCRKTELSTERAGRPMPNETLETPSEVLTPGSSALISRMPSIVSTADGFHSSSPVVSVKVSASKISSSRVHAVLVADEVGDALGDLELALARLRHPDLVDRQRDQRGAVRERDRDDLVELVAAGLEVDRVDDRAAGDLVERALDHLGLGRVDLDRRGLGERDLLDHPAHLLVLVLALGQRHADVEHVGAALDLVLGDLQQAVVVVGEQQLLGLARALRVHALADERRARLLHERGGGDHRGHVRRPRGGAVGRRRGPRRAGRARRCGRAWCRSSRRRCSRRSARRTRRARATSWSGVSGKIVSPFGPWCGMPAFGMQWIGTGRVLAEEADRVAHVLGAGRAVEADHVDLQRLERGQRGARCRCRAASCRRWAAATPRPGSACCGR